MNDERETSKNMSDIERLAYLKKILESNEKREAKQDEEVIRILLQGDIPTPRPTKDLINRRVGDKRLRIMTHHRHWKEHKLREGLRALVNAAHVAYVDICRHEAALTAFSQNSREFHNHDQHQLLYSIQKDVMAFCAASIGTIDTIRRIKNERPDISEAIDELIKSLFADDISKFIKDLRNNLSHGSVTIPGWMITTDRLGSIGTMDFTQHELLSVGTWSESAKKYISGEPGKRINIPKTAREYYKKIYELTEQLESVFANNVTPEERDYYKIEDEYKRIGGRQFMKILVSQVGKNRNPYEYLHLFFDPPEVRQILERPNHSKEQVEFIISLKIVGIDCDEELRQMLYTMFNV